MRLQRYVSVGFCSFVLPHKDWILLCSAFLRRELHFPSLVMQRKELKLLKDFCFLKLCPWHFYKEPFCVQAVLPVLKPLVAEAPFQLCMLRSTRMPSPGHLTMVRKVSGKNFTSRSQLTSKLVSSCLRAPIKHFYLISFVFCLLQEWEVDLCGTFASCWGVRQSFIHGVLAAPYFLS